MRRRQEIVSLAKNISCDNFVDISGGKFRTAGVVCNSTSWWITLLKILKRKAWVLVLLLCCFYGQNARICRCPLCVVATHYLTTGRLVLRNVTVARCLLYSYDVDSDCRIYCLLTNFRIPRFFGFLLTAYVLIFARLFVLFVLFILFVLLVQQISHYVPTYICS